ncbi:MAG: ATP-binding cassette domain-containing protein, partial [Lachnospiraceae bacterium]|nr:ATP-binding cassette domain-containing protein [Lachnospiraceae bacterium]
IDNRKFESKFHFFYVPDNKDMFLNLSGKEYLKFIVKLYRQNKKEADEKLQRLSSAFGLEQSLNEYIDNYSSGMKQKIYLIAAFLSGASNLILDEPFNGLDPESVAVLKQILIEYRNAGNLVVFSIHNLDLVANFCDDVVFIDKQRNVFQFSNPRNLKQLEMLFFQKCV